jgi:hypothetical protein
MSTAESRARSLPAPLRALAKPLVWLERSRGRRRLALLLAYATVGLIVGLFAWRAVSLNGLPDVGDPFDIAAFKSVRVPDDRNAFVLYRQAAAQLKKTAETSDFLTMYRVASGGWSKARPTIRAWVGDNRAALATWRRGTERPDAQRDSAEFARKPLDKPTLLDDLLPFAWMALLEGSRLEESGDMAGAWGWYNAALRSSRHIGTRTGYQGRAHGLMIHNAVGDRLVPWAKDPRTDAAALRRALRDMVAVEAMTPPFSEALKADYVRLLHAYDHPDTWLDPDQRPDMPLLHFPALRPLAVYFLREPERSRRIARLVFGHWLAYCDRPPAQRPRMSQPIQLGKHWGSISFPDFPYAVPPGPPDGHHPISAEDLARWMRSSLYAIYVFPSLPIVVSISDQERTSQGVLIVTLAEELYRREHGGAVPKSPRDLVGPYLDRLPDGYLNADPDEADAPAPKPTRPSP